MRELHGCAIVLMSRGCLCKVS